MNGAFFRRPTIWWRTWFWLGCAIIAVSAVQLTDPQRDADLLARYAVVPAYYAPGAGAYSSPVDFMAPLIGHAFLHGFWLHLAINMLAYFQLSSAVERRLSVAGSGAWRFLAVFAASAIAGAAAFIFLAPNTDVPAVGASGAICGLFAAYLLGARPSWRDAIRDGRIQRAALIFLAVNVVLMWQLAESGIFPIAWEAHLGGFIGGAVAFVLLAPRVPMFAGPWGPSRHPLG